jgi:hypothetical protein
VGANASMDIGLSQENGGGRVFFKTKKVVIGIHISRFCKSTKIKVQKLN